MTSASSPRLQVPLDPHTSRPKQAGFIRAVISPLLPAMLGSGAVRTVVTLGTSLGLLSDEDPTYIILQAIGDGFFYFFPILLAYSIARLQGSSCPLAILSAAILLHPDLSALMTGDNVSFLGLPASGVFYPTSVLPTVLLTLLQKPIERLAGRITPSPLQAILKPLLVLLTVIPIALWGIGPAFHFATDTLVTGFHYLHEVGDTVAVPLLSLLMPLLILLGFHHIGLDPADSDPWSLALLCATAALCGVALATLRSRDKQTRQIALGASITAVAGVPESAVYGVATGGFSLLIASVAAGAGGLYGTLTHMESVTEGSAVPLTALIYGVGGEGSHDLLHLSLTLLIPFLSGLGGDLWIQHIQWKKRLAESKRSKKDATPAFDQITRSADAADGSATPIPFASPISGEVIPLSRVSDPAFASGVMGQGCAILPQSGKIYAPCDGTVSSVSAGKNALSLDSTEGVQLLIHVGLNLHGIAAEQFDLCCRSGDQVKQGDLLLSFDTEALAKAEADLTTPLVVMNMERYDDLSLTCERHVNAGDRLLTLTPKKESR